MRLKRDNKGITITVVDRNVIPVKSKSITVYETTLPELVNAIEKMIESNSKS